MRLQARRWLFFLAVFLTVFLCDLAAARAAAPGWSLLDEVRALAEKNYAGPIDQATLEAGAVRGLVESLGDPYSEYIAPEDLSSFASSLNDEYTGVGIIFQEVEGQVVISNIVPGSPAARLGVRAGSVVESVDGRPVKGLPLEEVAGLLKGQPGTYLDLTVTMPGSDSRHSYFLRREVIRPPVVSSRLLAGPVGYLYLRSFPYWAPGEVETALAELEDQGARGLILDLRGNPGGYLDAALEIASLFLLWDKPVVQVVRRDKKVTVLRSRGPGQDLPMVVLVDRDTASAAEILAGALQANHAAILIGTRTYGKGALQTIFPLSNGGVLKLTTAYYLTPAGQAIDGEGLIPDIEVTEGREQLDRALKVLRAQIAPPLVAGNLACR
ncbi:Tail specific protease [Moorella glycerini]|uniref:CtpA-like serine protease n=1 Tax=Neomoorella stamsii TaxID=1266720 RepID=A0A9X7P529_9FIRM|nr:MULTISPECIES: S41 family peptidase [Moorella]PRR69959.1 putative CtpA-like serine protease [Moorella stamsii]CEP68490.1 Tail specific protease [Moorella glycerini]